MLGQGARREGGERGQAQPFAFAGSSGEMARNTVCSHRERATRLHVLSASLCGSRETSRRFLQYVIKRVTRQRVRYRSLAARKPKELRPATESLSVVESDPLPTTTHTKGLS